MRGLLFLWCLSFAAEEIAGSSVEEGWRSFFFLMFQKVVSEREREKKIVNGLMNQCFLSPFEISTSSIRSTHQVRLVDRVNKARSCEKRGESDQVGLCAQGHWKEKDAKSFLWSALIFSSPL